MTVIFFRKLFLPVSHDKLPGFEALDPPSDWARKNCQSLSTNRRSEPGYTGKWMASGK